MPWTPSVDPLFPYHLPIQAPYALYRAYFVYKCCNRVGFTIFLDICFTMSLVWYRQHSGRLLWISYHWPVCPVCSTQGVIGPILPIMAVIGPILPIRPHMAYFAYKICQGTTMSLDSIVCALDSSYGSSGPISLAYILYNIGPICSIMGLFCL